MSLSNWTVYQNDPNAQQVWRWHPYFLKLSERAEIDAGCSECEARNCRRSPVSPHLKGLLNRSARSELSRFASLLNSSFETTLRKAAHSPHKPATGRNTYMSASIWSSLWPAFSSAAWASLHCSGRRLAICAWPALVLSPCAALICASLTCRASRACGTSAARMRAARSAFSVTTSCPCGK